MIWPNATTTGVPAGKTLTTYNGTLIVTTPGAVIDGLNITGGVVVEAPNVTIQNCVITGSSWFVVLFDSSSGATNGTVLNCQIYGGGSGAAPGQHGVVGGHLIQGNNIHDVEQGIAPESGSTIQGNYIHDLNNPQADPHYDGILILGGSSDITIQNNTINNPHNQTDAIMIQNYNGPISNIIVNNNQLIGGGYTVYSDASHGTDAITGVQVTNNYIGGGAFGYVYFTGNSPLYAGNVDEFTGQLLPGQDAAALAITAFSTDSNIVGDGITNDNTLILSGNAPANSTIKVFDGTTQIGTTTANASGTWSYNTATLADGSHGFSISATSNGTTATSTALTVKVDTKAPSAPTITSFSSDTGTVGDHITSDHTLTLTGTAEANSTTKIHEGSTLLGSAVTNGSGIWNYTSAVLANGAHSLSATATDTAGNTGTASTPLSVTIATTTAVVPTIASFSTDSGTMGDHITNDHTLTLAGTAAPKATVKAYDGATLLGSAVANSSGAWSYTTPALADGAHKSLIATATDAAGHTGVASAAFGVFVDTIAPTDVLTSDSKNSNGSFKLSGTVLDNGVAKTGEILKFYDGPTFLGSTTVSSNAHWTFTTSTLSNTVHNFTSTATDVAGNVGKSTGVAIYGTSGTNKLGNSLGNDIMTGGGGTDTFVFNSVKFGKDVITDFQPQSSAHDIIDFSHNVFSSFAAVMAHAAQVGPDVVITVDAANSVTVKNVQISTLHQSDIHIV